MNKKPNKRQEKLLNRLPEIRADFEVMCSTRRDEITNELLKSDDDFQILMQQRADTSQVVLKILTEHGKADYYESYSNAVYAEEVYEFDMIYREAFLDAVEMIERLGFLQLK